MSFTVISTSEIAVFIDLLFQNYCKCGTVTVEAKKIYRLKEDQAFPLSLELGRRENVAWHPSADFLPLPHKESSPQPVPSFV
jgi:hypothetical protein